MYPRSSSRGCRIRVPTFLGSRACKRCICAFAGSPEPKRHGLANNLGTTPLPTSRSKSTHFRLSKTWTCIFRSLGQVLRPFAPSQARAAPNPRLLQPQILHPRIHPGPHRLGAEALPDILRGGKKKISARRVEREHQRAPKAGHAPKRLGAKPGSGRSAFFRKREEATNCWRVKVG